MRDNINLAAADTIVPRDDFHAILHQKRAREVFPARSGSMFCVHNDGGFHPPPLRTSIVGDG